MEEREVYIKQIEQLLLQGKQVFVESVNGQFKKVSKYIQKGTLKTYKVQLENGYQIKVSKQHKFFEKSYGWITCKNLQINKSKLLCDDGKYYKVINIIEIGFDKIVDITVDESHCYFGNGILNHNSGKSLVCAHLIKSCQQKGGIPVYIDTQGATSTGFWKAIGIDLDRVIVYDKIDKVETIHKITQQLMYSVKLNMPDTPMLIIVDSLTAAQTQAQLQNKDYQNKGYLAAIKAKMNSQALGKLAMMAATQNVALVYTAQVRAKMQVANKYMDPYGASSGGMALSFYASTEVRFAKKGKLKVDVYGVETVVGVRTKARIDKSRLGPTNRECEFDVLYDCGIDNYSNWLQTFKKYKIIQGKGTKNLPWVIKFQGKQIVIPGKFNTAIREDDKLREQVYDVLAQLLILKYKTLQQSQNREIFVEDDDQQNVSEQKERQKDLDQKE